MLGISFGKQIDPFEAFKAMVAEKGQLGTAKELGLSLTYVHDVYKGRRAIGPKMLAALGIEREVRYKLIGSSPEA